MVATGAHRFLRSVVLLLPVFGLCVALPASWLPGNYSNTVSGVLEFLSDYNHTAEEVLFFSVSASWNYNTNLTDHNSQLQVRSGCDRMTLHDLLGRAFARCIGKDFCGAELCLTWISLSFISLQNYMLSFIMGQPAQLVTRNIKHIRPPVLLNFHFEGISSDHYPCIFSYCI